MPILELNGATVEYAQEGEGPDLLLLHSLLTELTVFDRVVPALARRSRVTRINLPGFGRSSPLTLESIPAHADHLAAVMLALRLPKTADVFGNGFGGFVALELAIAHGDRFRRLMVADALATFPEPARAPFRAMAGKVAAAGMTSVLDTAIGRMLTPEFAAANPDVVESRKAALARVDPGCFARACLALAALDLRSEISSIRNPALVMCGALDQTTPPALARELAAGIPGALYQEISASGHCPMLEQPHALVDAMHAFLKNLDD
jgi:3-oxoadipate enol-lactonase